MVKLRYLRSFVFVTIYFLHGPVAATVEPLNNGYSSVAPASVAVLSLMPAKSASPHNEPRLAGVSKQAQAPAGLEQIPAPPQQSNALAQESSLSIRVEHEVDDVLSRKDGVSAALGAALTATLTSNPAAVLVGGLAGIWVGDKRSPGCDCEPMQLGEKASSLFRTVSKTMFKGGRYLYGGTKKIANKTGRTLKQMRDVNAPIPLPGQEPLIAADLTATVPIMPAKTAPTVALPRSQKKQVQAPITVVEPKKKRPKKTAKTQPPVISSIGAKKPTKSRDAEPPKQAINKMGDQQISADLETQEKPKVKQPEKAKTAVLTSNKKANAPIKKQEVSPRAEAKIALAAKRPEQQVTTPTKTAKPAVRASSKKLFAMPKLAVAATPASNAATSAVDQQWPEQSVAHGMDSAPVHRTAKAQPVESAPSAKAYTVPVAEGKVQAAQPTTQALDCDKGGDKIARGRLAWMECYYRME